MGTPNTADLASEKVREILVAMLCQGFEYELMTEASLSAYGLPNWRAASSRGPVPHVTFTGVDGEEEETEDEAEFRVEILVTRIK